MDELASPRLAAIDLSAALFAHSPDALLLVAPTTEQVLEVNPALEQWAGAPREELLSLSIRSLLRHEQQWPDWSRHADEAPREGFLLRQLAPPGWRPVALWLRRLESANAEPLWLFGLRDLGEAHDARRRAQRADAELRRALAAASDCLFCCQVERTEGEWRWRYRYLSPAAERLTGRPLAVLLESPAQWQQAVAPEDRPRWQALRAALLEGRGGEEEYHLVRPDGGRVRAREQVTVAPAEGGWLVHGAITELAGAEDGGGWQRALEHKVAGLTRLARGLAHDLNNLTTGTLGHIGLARLMGNEASAWAALDQIEAVALRAVELGRRLALLGGRDAGGAQPRDLNALARAVFEPAARFEAGALGPVAFDGDRLRGALEQLLQRAQAGGEEAVTARTYLGGLPPGEGLWWPSRPSSSEGPWAVVEVCGRGPALSPEALASFFDPFAPVGPERVAGLDLGLVWAVARAHRSAVQALSSPDTGICLRLLLPAEPAPAPALPRPAPPAERPNRLVGATVLLADDEEAVRDVVSRLLASLGCRVLLACDGEEALALLRQGPAAVALIDLHMPRLGGAAALREIHRLAPDMPLVVTSGLSENDVLAQLTGAPCAGYLQKPFRLPALLDVLERALRGVGVRG